jgi:hypothetical protein
MAVQGDLRFARIAGKWHALARRRLAYVHELERNGRWKLFYTSETFNACLREAEQTVQIWTGLITRMTSTCHGGEDARSAA